MTIASYSTWECRTTGNDNNGGGFAGDAALAVPAAPTLATAPTAGSGLTSWSVYFSTTPGGPYFLLSNFLALGTNRVVTTTPPTSGINPFGIDRSQQDAPQLVINNTTVTSTTPALNSNTLTFTAGYTPTAADIGNFVNITGGTNINPGIYQVTGWTSTTWTLSGVASLTTATGPGSAVTGNLGGALATPGRVAQLRVANGAGSYVWVKAGTYVCSN